MAEKYVYLFDEGNAGMRDLLGGKGANLAEMTGLGLPVPYGFTVTTEACTRYYADGKRVADEIVEQIFEALEKIETLASRKDRRRYFMRLCRRKDKYNVLRRLFERF